MRLLYMRFFYVKNKKFDRMPVRSIRKERAFINTSVPRIVAFPVLKVGKKTVITRPSKGNWADVRLGKLLLLTYPEVKGYEWFTYRKVNGKVKRLTLSQYLLKEKREP